ncbi:hypothetical protein HQ346_16650 [Rhodococcus sp. BP-252]|uniref:hypothetical protein n=1 Tax=unclassified Rhodococcus (in: high G+C Gram-positive bacteria) TaxID=192944 RepID=UPI001C9BB4C3|nr:MULTISPECIES: hypothetical protein [unclassified Rhodococcus (in: high G+C Gram-positive bacteria)]MBY6413326.1 hypothetical protein [Rhodococcus sp. BP-320]MBY6418070.1 hypothetical protein [Rhodococcus sp. BP-321]MBY6422240.1 hypothetical protein [Rhodococcus sp. BP-324]MBY6428119.1 hypothetical protein [Rhodococcus sp. BP-323]MBY6433247.1 hypothetical protein [Rhodococcus sp. BP-322]
MSNPQHRVPAHRRDLAAQLLRELVSDRACTLVVVDPTSVREFGNGSGRVEYTSTSTASGWSRSIPGGGVRVTAASTTAVTCAGGGRTVRRTPGA